MQMALEQRNVVSKSLNSFAVYSYKSIPCTLRQNFSSQILLFGRELSSFERERERYLSLFEEQM